MSMSTNLNDLPGPSEKINVDDIEMYKDEDYQDYQDNQDNQDNQGHQGHQGQQGQHQSNYDNEEYFDNVPASLKKKEIQNSPIGILDIISNETKYHGKENLLLLVILFISTLRYSDEYTRKIMTLLSFSVTNVTMISVIKALLLLILFIICKYYLLPLI